MLDCMHIPYMANVFVETSGVLQVNFNTNGALTMQCLEDQRFSTMEPSPFKAQCQGKKLLSEGTAKGPVIH